MARAGAAGAGAGAAGDAVAGAAGASVAGAAGVVTAAGGCVTTLDGADGAAVGPLVLLSCFAGAASSVGAVAAGAPSVRCPGIDDVTIGSAAGVAAVAGCCVAAGAVGDASCARTGSEAARASVEARHRAARRMAVGLSSGSGMGTVTGRFLVRIGIWYNCLRKDDCFAFSSQVKRIDCRRMCQMFGRFAAIGCESYRAGCEHDAAATDDQRDRHAGRSGPGVPRNSCCQARLPLGQSVRLPRSRGSASFRREINAAAPGLRPQSGHSRCRRPPTTRISARRRPTISR